MKRLLLAFIAFYGSSGLGAFSYPTVWLIHNAANSSVFVECRCGPPAGLPNSIGMHTSAITPFMQFRHEWSGYYNDGLGMNPARWTCAASAYVNPLSQNLQTMSFDTTWGEDLFLSVVDVDGALLVAKRKP